ncbi:MAG: hypothetical protein WDM90_13420 [Ferruginibacter sp.]
MSLLLYVACAQVRSLPAIKITQPIIIDGDLNDNAWKDIVPVGNFITFNPHAGLPSAHKTEVKIAYDNDAVYVGAYMYDNPENIRKQLTARDVLKGRI